MPNEQLFQPRTITARALGVQVDHKAPDISDRDQEEYQFPDLDGYKRAAGAVVLLAINE